MSESEFFHRLDVRVGGSPVREMRHDAIQEKDPLNVLAVKARVEELLVSDRGNKNEFESKEELFGREYKTHGQEISFGQFMAQKYTYTLEDLGNVSFIGEQMHPEVTYFLSAFDVSRRSLVVIRVTEIRQGEKIFYLYRTEEPFAFFTGQKKRRGFASFHATSWDKNKQGQVAQLFGVLATGG